MSSALMTLNPKAVSRSAGQASSIAAVVSGQGSLGSVPINISSSLVQPSQSGSPTGTVHGGRPWPGLGQSGQLSVLSGSPSPSESRLFVIVH